MRRPGATRGFAQPGHRQDHQQLWLPVWLPNDHLKDRGHAVGLLNSGRRWARTTGPSLVRRVRTVAGRGWAWAWCGICQPRLWLDVAWRGLVPVVVGSPFGSPSSLAPLTFNEHERQPEARYSPAMATRERSMTVRPMSSREGSGVNRRETLRRSTIRHRPGPNRLPRLPRRQIAMSPLRDRERGLAGRRVDRI